MKLKLLGPLLKYYIKPLIQENLRTCQLQLLAGMPPKLIPDTYFTTTILIWLPFFATRFSNHQGTVLRGLSAEVVTVTREPGWKSRKATPLGKQRGRKRSKHLYTPQKSNVDSKKWPYGPFFEGVHLFQTIILGHGYVSFPGCTHGNRIKPNFGEFRYHWWKKNPAPVGGVFLKACLLEFSCSFHINLCKSAVGASTGIFNFMSFRGDIRVWGCVQTKNHQFFPIPHHPSSTQDIMS